MTYNDLTPTQREGVRLMALESVAQGDAVVGTVFGTIFRRIPSAGFIEYTDIGGTVLFSGPTWMARVWMAVEAFQYEEGQ